MDIWKEMSSECHGQACEPKAQSIKKSWSPISKTSHFQVKSICALKSTRFILFGDLLEMNEHYTIPIILSFSPKFHKVRHGQNMLESKALEFNHTEIFATVACLFHPFA